MELYKEGFSKKAIDQAEAAARIKPASKLSRRNDFRSKTIFTFADTPDTPSDLAFSIARSDDGWRLGVHVSDVDEYICEGSPLDNVAKERIGTIINDFEIKKMLPDRISKDVCNLLKDKDRLAVSINIDITNDGDIGAVSVEESVIRVSENFIYSEVDKFTSTTDASAIMALRAKYSPFNDNLLDMFELTSLLCNNRRKRGGLNCTYFRRVYNRNAEGKIDSFERIAEPDTRAMIRELGYFAGEAVGSYMLKQKLPCVFSGRGAVPDSALDYLSKFVGCDARIKDPAKRAADIADKAKGTLYYDFVCDSLASSLPSVVYSSKRIQNSFCGCDHIVSFFSPASSYTDLLIQRVLKIGIRAGRPENLNLNRFKKILAEVCELSNSASQYFYETSRKYRRKCAYEYVANNVNTVFRGTPVSVQDNGAIVVILECALYVIVPPKFAAALEVGEELNHFYFELIQIGGENDQILVKPII